MQPFMQHRIHPTPRATPTSARTARAARARRSLAGVLVLIGLALSFVPSRASADARTDARARFRAGMELVAAGNVDAGVAELEAAYAILPHPHVLYNIARAYGEAGRYEEAIEYFERYLAGEPPDREDVRGFVAALRERLAQARAAASPGTAPVAAPTTPAPDNPPAPNAIATPEEILALEESATQIETLGEATDSDVLRQRAQSLRTLAQQLRAGLAAAETPTPPDGTAGTETGSDTSVVTPPEPAEQPEETVATPAGALELGQQQENLYDETVVSASRFAQNPLDAPNAVANVTRQDIRLSGLVNPGELVVRTPGAHVMFTGASDVQIGIRGFNRRFSPRVLTLINGRSIYIDTLGTNFYWSTPYAVEDIERIEVIRGPASALYGANAFSGVINIITREPGSDPGTEARMSVGNMRQVHGQVSNSGGMGGFTYRLSAGYDQSFRYTREIVDGTVGRTYAIDDTNYDIKVARANGHLRYTLRPNLYADLQAGFSGGFQVFQSQGFLREFQMNQRSANVMTTFHSPWGYLRAFWNKFDGNSGATGPNNLLNDFGSHTLDVEGAFTRQFHFLVDHNLSVGLAYRLKTIAWDYLDADHHENHFNGFFQDTMRISDYLIVVASLRVDRHPLLSKLQVSPRAAVIVRPTDGQAIRFSVGRAFRQQTFLDSYLQLRVSTPLQAVGVDSLGSEITERMGRGQLEPESILSSEVGYRFAESTYFDVDVAAYYNVVRDLVIDDDLYPLTLAEYADGLGRFDDDTGSFLVGTTGVTNDPTRFHVVGGEIAVRAYPVAGLDIYANYAYNHAILGGDTERRTSDVAPAHLLNAGVQYRSPFGLDLSADLHFASKQTWEEQDFDLSGGAAAEAIFVTYDLPSYYFLNARVGYRLLEDDLELGFSAFNLTNNKHRQHPFGQEIGMRLLGTVAYRF